MIGVDNGVMPVEQMEVTITRPIEDAVNSVPGLVTVRSTTSRGSAEVSLFFDWNVDMVPSLQLVDAALAKVEQTLPPTARITTNRLDLCHISRSLATASPPIRVPQNAALGDCHVRSEAAAESRRRREHGGGAGRPGAGVSRHAEPGAAAGFGRHHSRPRERHRGFEHRRLARTLRGRSSA